MTLNQFGAVMTFAVDLENRLVNFYEKASTSESNYELKMEYKQRAVDSKTRQKKLEKSRRENVTEIILEPIEGLNEPNLNLDSFENFNQIETSVAQFYLDASDKINVLEAKRVLKKCYKQHKSLSG